jgi:dCMP deaminase
MNQLTEDLAHLDAAGIYAQRLSRCNRLKVCCLIIKGNSFVRGINGMPSGGDNDCEDEAGNSKPEVQHAEDNAILQAARYGIALEGCAVYLTHAPCARCAAKLCELGVSRVVYRDVYRDLSGVKYLNEMGIECYQLQHFA